MSDGADIRVPIVEEEVAVAKRAAPTEHVRVRTAVETRDELVTGDLRIEALEIERRSVERPVEAAPPPRQEGDATIISIVEERAVVTRQLFVVEEIVVHRRAIHEPFAVPMTLRRTRAEVERARIDPVQQENH